MNFDDYIQELLGNPNPKGNMLTGASAPTDNFYTQALTSDYYNNRFKRPDSIDAGIATRVEEDETLYKLLGLPTTTGMLGSDSGGGYDGPNNSNTGQDPNAFVDIDQINTVLSVFDALTNAVPTPISLALSAYAAFQDPSSVINNPHSLFEQLTNPALNAREDDSPVPQYGQIPSMQAAVNAQANAMPVDPGVQAAVNANQAVTSPVNMSFSPSTPIGTLGGGGGGDLGEGTSDAAGFGGYGGVW